MFVNSDFSDLLRLFNDNSVKGEVDLLTEAALSPYLHDRIVDELQVIYNTG